MIPADYSNSEIEEIIKEYIHSERDRSVLYSRYIDGYTYEKIAEKHDLSVRHIKNIIYKHENTIFMHLEKKSNLFKP